MLGWQRRWSANRSRRGRGERQGGEIGIYCLPPFKVGRCSRITSESAAATLGFAEEVFVRGRAPLAAFRVWSPLLARRGILRSSDLHHMRAYISQICCVLSSSSLPCRAYWLTNKGTPALHLSSPPSPPPNPMRSTLDPPPQQAYICCLVQLMPHICTSTTVLICYICKC